MDRLEAMNSKVLRMTESPVEGLVMRMAAPTMITMLVTAMYNIADTYFVGGIGTTATAAVGVSYPLMAVIMAVGFLFGHGAGNAISRELGSRNYDRAARIAATGLLSALAGGTLIAGGGLLFQDRLALALGSTDTILPYAKDYLFYILLAAPFMAASFTLNNILRFQGNAVYGMVGIAVGAVLNIILDPIFIYTLGMGVKGASLATMISQCAGFFLLLAGAMRQESVPISPGNISCDPGVYREIFQGGFPSLCRQGLASLAVVCLNQMAGHYGDAAIAGMAIVQRAGMFVGALLVGFGHGFQPVCGFNFGACRFARMKRAFWFCVRVSTVALIAIAIALFLCAPEVIGLFRPDDPEVIAIGGFALRAQCLTFPFMGWILISNMTMQNIGRAGRASLMALARQGLFMIPFLFLVTPRLGLIGIQIAQPVADVLSLLLSIPVAGGVLRSIPNSDENVAVVRSESIVRRAEKGGGYDLEQHW